jgi:hypothetical protein
MLVVSPVFSQCLDMFTTLQRMLPREVVASTKSAYDRDRWSGDEVTI